MRADAVEHADVANLEKVDHVVVVMLENRSFDHMLGYLSLTGRRPDIDGLRPGLANRVPGAHLPGAPPRRDGPGYGSRPFRGRHRPAGRRRGHERLRRQRGRDPGRARRRATATRAASWATTTAPMCRSTTTWRRSSRSATAGSASVAGATLPNRLYALCGAAAGSRDDRPAHMPPLYHQPSFVRHLDAHDVSWRWYSFDPGTLRLADVHYRLGHHDRFGYFSKTGLPWQTIFDITCNPKIPSFLEDAAAGTLRQVSWIDPAFTNFNPLGFPVNDDHPPADVKDGQDLVLAIYDALAASPQWERSLLVIVYDENGGFYDHVPPPPAADDEPEMFGRYGVRVPAIIVSPWIEPRTASHTLFDHTSIIKTILSRFCPDALQRPAGGERKAGRAGPGPAIPRLARGPGQPSGGTADTHHTTSRPAAGRPRAASRGQGRPSRNRRPVPARGRRRRAAQRPAEEHPRRDAQTERRGHPPDTP